MRLCISVSDEEYIYIFTGENDLHPILFYGVTRFPLNKKTETFEVEEEESDEGEYRVNEMDFFTVPTNAYKLIEFKSERHRKRFVDYIEEYYSKEIT
jgi:hypothetical protein